MQGSNSMVDCSLVYLLLFLALAVSVHCNTHTDPQFEFRGSVLTNNSYVLRGPVDGSTSIGEGVNNSLHCVTDYMNCYNSGSGTESGLGMETCSGSGMGNWYDTRGMEVSDQADEDSDIYVTRGDGVVYLNRRRG